MPLRASDVAFGSDVHCVSDVSPYGEVGKHHPLQTLNLCYDIGRKRCTFIGAYIHEAQYAQGKNDLISKLEIALKVLSDKCATHSVMLVFSYRKAKSNIDNK